MRSPDMPPSFDHQLTYAEQNTVGAGEAHPGDEKRASGVLAALGVARGHAWKNHLPAPQKLISRWSRTPLPSEIWQALCLSEIYQLSPFTPNFKSEF